MLGTLEESARVFPLAFHVDYFNDPWKDPFSSPIFTQREARYSLLYDRTHKVGKKDYLYFTPMLMVDGRTPMLGSGSEAPGKAKAAIQKALRESPELAIGLEWGSAVGPRGKELKLAIRARTPRAEGREVLVGIATYEDPLVTNVGAGELKGKVYTGRHVVRDLEVKSARPGRSRAAELNVSLTLGEDWEPGRCGVVVFAQDDKTGRVIQAARLAWEGPMGEDRAAGR